MGTRFDAGLGSNGGSLEGLGTFDTRVAGYREEPPTGLATERGCRA